MNSFDLPNELLFNVFQNLSANELNSSIKLVSKKWRETIERSSLHLSKIIIKGKLEVRSYKILKLTNENNVVKEITAKERSLNWDSGYIIKNLVLENFPWTVSTLNSCFPMCNKPIVIENLVIYISINSPFQFHQEYEDFSTCFDPIHINYQNLNSLAHLKFIRSSSLFLKKSIKSLNIFARVSVKRPFAEMSVNELIEFIGNADNNKGSLKECMQLNWTFNGVNEFAELLVQKFLISTMPDQFFRKFYSICEGNNARNTWKEYFINNGSNQANNNRFIGKHRIFYEISRHDGWKIAFGEQVKYGTAIYTYHASDVKS